MGDGRFTFRHVDTLGTDRIAYRRLHNLLFANTAMSSDWIDWFHTEVATAGGGREARTYGLFDGEILAGIWSVEPREFTVDGRSVIPVGHCFAVGIHPEYQRQGLFVELSKYALEQEKIRGEMNFILGFPQQDRPVVGGHLKAGWEIVQDIDAWRIAPDSMDLATPRARVETLQSFSGAANHGPLAGSFTTPPDYLTRRWLQHPDNHYICYECAGGFVVLKPYGGVCHVLELQGSPDAARTLLGAAKTLCRRHGWKELNAWCAPNERYRAQMTEVGFEPGAEFARPVVLIAARINSAAPLALVDCHLPIGIEEIY
jgi:GNAT superfamily N-acetyltransferase